MKNGKAEADKESRAEDSRPVDARARKPMSEAQLKKFGYVKTEGGVWELPTHILKAAGVKMGKNTSARRLTRT
jgi:hypothetical protein